MLRWYSLKRVNCCTEYIVKNVCLLAKFRLLVSQHSYFFDVIIKNHDILGRDPPNNF